MSETKMEEIEDKVQDTKSIENSTEVKEEVVEEIDLSKFKSKDDDRIIKVDLSKPPKSSKEDGIPEQQTEEVDEDTSTGIISEVDEEVRTQDTESTDTGEEVSIIQEITNEEEDNVKEESQQVVEQTPQPDPVILPENVDKLVNFMEETGGTIEDYVRLNADYSNIDNNTLLIEYYKKNKPHLDIDEINFLMEEKFAYDEDMDEERDIRKKKLALKEEVAKARGFLDELKSKYYDEIKLRPGVTQEQKKATDFFNRYNEEQKVVQQRHDEFKNATKKFFTNDFKGFDFNVGEKKFRYGVNSPSDVASAQSNLTTFVKKFLNDDGSVKDYKGYHKAIYAARNADTIAQHFYEQGKADAVKDLNAKSKNLVTKPRTESSGEVYLNGLRVKAISGIDSSKLKIKTRKK